MMDIDRRYLLAGLAIIIIIVFFGGIKYADFRRQAPDEEVLLSQTVEGKKTEETNEVQVYVGGEVEKPGLYKLENGSRVYEALDKAGILPTGDLQSAQPARKIQDGETIILYPLGQTPQTAVNPNSNNQTAALAQGFSSGNTSGLININTASAQELDELPGIGPTLAQRIIDYRNSNGSFSSVEDINNVSGIGDKKFADIKDLITVR